jgi:hypothetical protein
LFGYLDSKKQFSRKDAKGSFVQAIYDPFDTILQQVNILFSLSVLGGFA